MSFFTKEAMVEIKNKILSQPGGQSQMLIFKGRKKNGEEVFRIMVKPPPRLGIMADTLG